MTRVTLKHRDLLNLISEFELAHSSQLPFHFKTIKESFHIRRFEGVSKSPTGSCLGEVDTASLPVSSVSWRRIVQRKASLVYCTSPVLRHCNWKGPTLGQQTEMMEMNRFSMLSLTSNCPPYCKIYLLET